MGKAERVQICHIFLTFFSLRLWPLRQYDDDERHTILERAGFKREEVVHSLRNMLYDHRTAAYMLLGARKKHMSDVSFAFFPFAFLVAIAGAPAKLDMVAIVMA